MMNTAFRNALLCWAIPLAAGVCIFAAWLPTRSEVLAGLGAGLLVGGTALFCIGLVELGISIEQRRRDASLSRRGRLASSALCAGLLLSNFPVAGAMTIHAMRIDSRCRIVVHNESASVWEEVRVVGAGARSEPVTVRPGAVETIDVWARTEGSLELSGRRGGALRSRDLDVYVTSGLGVEVHVTIEPDDSMTVDQRR